MNNKGTVVQIPQKSRSAFKILGSTGVTQSKFHKEDQ
jgi:hypothetical protein